MPVAGHEIMGEIARGGMGIVYRARQLDPRRTVALKMLLPQQLGSAEMAERFRLEARALAELDHPAILPVYQVGEHDGLPFFTMKLATGGTLAERRARLAGQCRAVAALMAELADAVQFAHERGVLHRDLKPGNILFDEKDRPYVSDFGLAKLAGNDSDLTRSVDFLGTPLYVAPEIATRSARYATTASDIYGLGAVLYELLAGRPPFEAEGLPGLLKRIAEEEPATPSRQIAAVTSPPSGEPGAPAGNTPGPALVVPRDLEVICLKCLAKEPARRYISAGELAKDLRCWLGGKPITARPVSRAERSWKWMRRNPILTGLGAALVVTLAGGGLGLWRSYQQVRQALGATRQAQGQAQSSLRAALLSQAEALGAAHSTGQRWRALEVLGEAARLRPGLDVRNEVAAALARQDLKEAIRFPARFGAAGTPVVFSPDLDRYVVAEPTGFSLRRVNDQSVVANFSGPAGRGTFWFILDGQARHVGALLSDYSLETWSFDKQKPELRWLGTAQQPPAVEFHPDGVSLAGCVPGEGVFLQRLDGSERRSLASTNGRAIHLRFDPAGTRLAMARDPGGVELWSSGATPKLLWMQPMGRVVPWLAWSPDGQRLAAAADDGRGLRVFSAESGEIDLVYSRHVRYPRQFEFAPNGRMVASLGDDWALRLWDARTGQDLVTGTGRHRVLRFSRDGRRLTTAPTDSELAVLELAPELVFREFSGTGPAPPITSGGLACSADGRYLLITGPQVHSYDAHLGAELGVLPAPSPLAVATSFFESVPCSVVYSRAGQGIYRRNFLLETNGPGSARLVWGPEQLVARQPRALVGSTVQGGRTWVWQSAAGLELGPAGAPSGVRHIGVRGSLAAVRVSPDARLAAVAETSHHRVVIWDCAADQVLTNLTASAPDRVWFSPDSRWLVASCENAYRAWATVTWQPVAGWEAHLDSGAPGELSFSDDSRLVAARQERGIFRLLSFPQCRELVTLTPPMVLPVGSALLKGDGSRLWLLTGGFRVFEWDLGALRAELVKLGLDWE
jgi:WD40 repeat protein